MVGSLFCFILPFQNYFGDSSSSVLPYASLRNLNTIPGRSTDLQKLRMKIVRNKTKQKTPGKRPRFGHRSLIVHQRLLLPFLNMGLCRQVAAHPHHPSHVWMEFPKGLQAWRICANNKPGLSEISWPTIHVLLSFSLARTKTNPLTRMLGTTYQKGKSHMMDKPGFLSRYLESSWNQQYLH